MKAMFLKTVVFPFLKPRIKNKFRNSITADRRACMGTLLGTPRIGPEKPVISHWPELVKHATLSACPTIVVPHESANPTLGRSGCCLD